MGLREKHSTEVQALREKAETEAKARTREVAAEAVRQRQAAEAESQRQRQATEAEAQRQRQGAEAEAARREAEAAKQVEAEQRRAEAEIGRAEAAKQQAEAEKRQAEAEKRQAEAHRQQAEAEVASLRERMVVLEKERNEQAAAAESTRAAVRRQEQRSDALQVELASLSSKLDSERTAWAKEADEAHRAALSAEEQRRSNAVKALQEEHKRQVLKQQAAFKKALQKCAKKRQEYKLRCQDLAKRLSRLSQERQLAVRVCEENRSAYEVKLAEMGLTAGAAGRLSCGSLVETAATLTQSGALRGCDSPRLLAASGGLAQASLQRRELRAISDRLEQHAAWLRDRPPGPTDSRHPASALAAAPAAAAADAGP